MRLLARLRQDHDVLEQVRGSLCAYADLRAAGAAAGADAHAFVGFFRAFGGRHHHAAEEHVLFPALVDHAELPGDRGPLYGVDCDGLEREWWTEHEWDEAAEHLGD
jgi:hemerythrin-like domain-containing protein